MMKADVGVVLVEGLPYKTTIPAHQISLLGRPAFSQSVEVLKRTCIKVLVETVDSDHLDYCGILAGLLGRIRVEFGRRLRQDSLLVLHDALRPIIDEHLIHELVELLRAGATAVAASPAGNPDEFGRSERPVLEPPFGFRIGALEAWLYTSNRQCRSISEIVHHVTIYYQQQPSVVIRRYLSGRLFSNMTLDEAEGLLSLRPRASTSHLEDAVTVLSCVLVYGGTGGIGKACLELLGSKGLRVIAPKRAEVDLRVERNFSHLRLCNAAIHAAGMYAGSSEEIMAVNFHSCLRLVRAAEAGAWRGSIVLLSSTAAIYGRASAPEYSASKAALNAYVQAESARLAKKGIVLSAVAPAKVATKLQEVLNPGTPRSLLIEPSYVAKKILGALMAAHSGSITYIRKGEDI